MCGRMRGRMRLSCRRVDDYVSNLQSGYAIVHFAMNTGLFRIQSPKWIRKRPFLRLKRASPYPICKVDTGPTVFSNNLVDIVSTLKYGYANVPRATKYR